jgi:hypothetical protein
MAMKPAAIYAFQLPQRTPLLTSIYMEQPKMANTFTVPNKTPSAMTCSTSITGQHLVPLSWQTGKHVYLHMSAYLDYA